MLIVDGHEDLALNALADGRDYLTSAYDIRRAEEGTSIPDEYGHCMLGLKEWLQGHVAVIFATIQAIPRQEARHGELSYLTPQGAHQQGLAQVDLYRRWEAENRQIKLVTHQAHLDQVLASWKGKANLRQIGLVLLMENADSIRHPSETPFWYEQGLRVIGPAWHNNRYTGSTHQPGPLTDYGRDLLREMQKLGFILDISHMADEAVREALRVFEGTIIASHANLRRFVPMDRLLPDEFVKAIALTDGVIGLMPAAWAIDPSWKEHRSRSRVSLRRFVEIIDAACQITGSADHVGIGSDFDGGFGSEAVPHELDTVADLQLLVDELIGYGFSKEDVEKTMSGNWLRLLQRTLP